MYVNIPENRSLFLTGMLFCSYNLQLNGVISGYRVSTIILVGWKRRDNNLKWCRPTS